MNQEVYYKKEGDEYIPVSYYDSNMLDAFPAGATLVVVKEGSVSRMYDVDIAFAPMIAAGKYALDDIADAIHKASEARPTSRTITEEQREAWEHFQKVMGDRNYYLQYDSVNVMAKAGIKAMENEVDRKMNDHPNLKKAYDDFMLLWKLSV